MVGNTLGNKANNYLTIAIATLSVLVSVALIWQMSLISAQNARIEKQEQRLSELPDKYVMLERYGCDMATLGSTIADMKKDLREDIKALGRKLDQSIYRPYTEHGLNN